MEKKKIFSAKSYAVKLKATIHASGRLGFTEATARHLGLTPESGIQFFIDEKDSLCLQVLHTRGDDEDAFPVNFSSEYYSVNPKAIFDELGIDYKSARISFDLVRIPGEEDGVYRMLSRELGKK